jgi:hypothetical protein
MRKQRNGLLTVGALAIGVLPLALASPAVADPHTATLTVGPVILPSVPVELCVDGDCTPESPMANATLTVEATTDGDVQPVVAEVSACPDGELGLAIRATTATAASATLTVTVNGTGVDGESRTIVVGPRDVTLDPPGAVASLCTTD